MGFGYANVYIIMCFICMIVIASLYIMDSKNVYSEYLNEVKN